MNGKGPDIVNEIVRLRRSLRTLDVSFSRLAPMLSAAAVPGGAPRERRGRRRPRLSAKARASLVLQGRYMGYMRQLDPKQKARVRKIREVKGVRVAIQRARQVLA